MHRLGHLGPPDASRGAAARPSGGRRKRKRVSDDDVQRVRVWFTTRRARTNSGQPQRRRLPSAVVQQLRAEFEKSKYPSPAQVAKVCVTGAALLVSTKPFVTMRRWFVLPVLQLAAATGEAAPRIAAWFSNRRKDSGWPTSSRPRFSKAAVGRLQAAYQSSATGKLKTDELKRLAQELGEDLGRIRVWFNNRRRIAKVRDVP